VYNCLEKGSDHFFSWWTNNFIRGWSRSSH